MTPLDRITAFVLSVLLGGDGRASLPAARFIHYGDPACAPDEAKLVIRPSELLQAVTEGREGFIPTVPLPEHDGLPVLFGQPGLESRGGRIILHNDVVAAAFFLLTRYEERLRPEDRDAHGRFPGLDSLLGRAGLTARPVVDEFGKFVRNLLRTAGVDLAEPPERIRTICLTHDIDRPFAWHRLRPAVGEFGRRSAKLRLLSAPVPLLTWLGVLQADPNDSFDWIFSQDRALADALGAQRVQTIYFVMAGGTGAKDGRYELRSRHVQRLLRRVRTAGAELGLHASYEAGQKPALLRTEAETLRATTGDPIDRNRHHFLAWREPDHFQAILDAGIRHDYTMGFPDLAGFRLGTSRSFFWFDVVACRSTDLEVHPTTIMDCTLDDPARMNLPYSDARACCERLIDATRRHHGDLTLLWHNTEVTPAAAARGCYHRNLYHDLLQHLARN